MPLDTLLGQLAGTSWVEWLGMVSGIAGVWFSIKQKLLAWPLFILCYSCYVAISYRLGLYAFMGMNLAFIGISAYGWLQWRGRARRDEAELPLSRTRRAHWPLIAAFIVLATGGIGCLLAHNEEARLPYLDALATSCGLTAQWLLSRKQIETWLFWIITDLIYIGLFAYGQSWPSVILFSVFIGLALKGWKEWRSVLRSQT